MQAYDHLARLYDADWGDFAEACLPLILRVLDRDKPIRIADLACGTGTLALALAERGHDVLGVDRSNAMLAIARSKAAHTHRVAFEHCDVLEWRPDKRFDAVTCMFDSVNYLKTHEQMTRFFENVARALPAEGDFIFDANRPSVYAENAGDCVRRVILGEMLIQELNYDPQTCISRTIFRFSDGSTECHTQRAYDLSELLPLLNAVGLEVRETFGGLNMRPLTEACGRMILVCQRKDTRAG